MKKIVSNNLKTKENKSLFNVIKGCVFSFIISIICLFIYAIILVNTNIKENTITPVIMVITAVSILIGSSISCIKVKKNGIVNGLCIGGIYFGTLFILSSIIYTGFTFNLKSIILILSGTITGGIGGIIGVNIKK